MAERLRSTGRKSNSACAAPAGRVGGLRPGTASATASQATAAVPAAIRKAACHPKCVAIWSPSTKESAPEMPMLAAWPVTARDIIRASTWSASSFSPVI